MFTTDQAKAAKNLATCYAAYLESCASSDDDGVIAWGGMLLKAQTETGVELLTPDSIERLIRVTRYSKAMWGKEVV